MAHKHAQEHNEKHRSFPIESLPLELLHEVFAYLKPSEAAELRLFSRRLAAVGLQYLVPELHLIVKQDSLDRLQEISKYPVVSQHVTSLWYEADRLYHKCFHVWEQGVRSEEWFKNAREASTITPPCPGASGRDLRAYRRAKYNSRVPRHRYTQSQLETHFATYQALISQQARILGSTFHMDLIKQVMSRCSRIKEVFMSTEGFNRPSWSCKVELNPFAEAHSWAAGDEGHDLPCGLPQTRALLLGAFDAGLQLEKVSCGSVSWQLLQLSSKEISKFKSVFRSVRQLALHFSTGAADENDDPWVAGPSSEIPKCKKYLKQTGRLKELVTAAPDLTSLTVGFDWGQPYSATKLKYIVGDFTWQHLTHFSFREIDATEEDLVGFCSRHANISHFNIDCIALTKGTWPSTFRRMRRILKIQWAHINGVLQQREGAKVLNVSRRAPTGCGHKYGDVIESYLRSWPDEHDWTLEEFCGPSDLDHDDDSLLDTDDSLFDSDDSFE